MNNCSRPNENTDKNNENVEGTVPLSVVFCLSPALDCAERQKDMMLAEKLLPEEGIRCSAFLHADPDEDGPEETEPVLYVTDSAELYRDLTEKGRKTAGYLHDGNRREHFTDAPYLLEEPQYVEKDSYVKIWQRLSGVPWTIAVTKRLRIREMVPEDTDAEYLLYADPETGRFLPPLPADRNQEQDILRAYAEKVYGLYGYGMWAVCLRSTGELIGRIGFEPYQGGDRAVGMGYLIRADYRGQGLAREAGEAVLHFADENLGFPAIAIRTDRRNTPSAALALTLGFREIVGPGSAEDGRSRAGETETRLLKENIDGRNGIRYFIRLSGGPEYD